MNSCQRQYDRTVGVSDFLHIILAESVARETGVQMDACVMNTREERFGFGARHRDDNTTMIARLSDRIVLKGGL